MPTWFAWLLARNLVVMGQFDGAITALALDGSSERWHAKLGHRLEAFAGAPDGSRLAATGDGGRTVILLDAATGAIERTITIAPLPRQQRSDWSLLAWSDDSKTYAWQLADGRLARGEVSEPRELHISPGSAELTGSEELTFTPDGKQVLTTRVSGERLGWALARFPAQH
jgi:WD40 repeat protein